MRERCIGVLLFQTTGSRMIGDPGMPGTFEFPVEYGIVSGSYRDYIAGSPAAKEALCQAALTLEQRRVAAITGDCGLMALYQAELADCVRVPVVASSLVLLPLMKTILPAECSICVVTGHSGLLGEQHLAAAGAADRSNLVICGMENEPHFASAVIEGKEQQDFTRMRQDVLHAVGNTFSKNGGIGAILLECSNLAAFGYDLERTFHVPVFDINLAIRMLWHAVSKPNYAQRAEFTQEQANL